MNTRSAAQKAAASANPPAFDAQITKFFKPSSTARSATGGIRKRSAAPKQKHPAGYAPPSKFAHVQNSLSDTLEPGLICVFIGLNPGIQTATTGHAYAHPSNLFWRLLHSSGCTARRCTPSETYALPQLYGLGNTNIVERPTANGAQLSKKEMDDGVQILDEKVAKCRPQAVVIVGKSIWESIWRVWKRRAITKTEFKYGWQDDTLRMGNSAHASAENQDQWPGARVFVATTTSGLAASMKPAEKETIWRQLGEWVEQEREKAGLIGDRYLENGVVVCKT